MLRKFIISISLVGYTLLSYAGGGEYPVSAIPEALLKKANAVKRTEQISFEVVSDDEAVLRKKYAITVLNENGDKHAFFSAFFFVNRNRIARIIKCTEPYRVRFGIDDTDVAAFNRKILIFTGQPQRKEQCTFIFNFHFVLHGVRINPVKEIMNLVSVVVNKIIITAAGKVHYLFIL